jgi:hypothetical protein
MSIKVKLEKHKIFTQNKHHIVIRHYKNVKYCKVIAFILSIVYN